MGRFTIRTNKFGQLFPEDTRITANRESHLDGTQGDKLPNGKDHLLVANAAGLRDDALRLSRGRPVGLVFANPQGDDPEAKNKKSEGNEQRMLRR